MRNKDSKKNNRLKKQILLSLCLGAYLLIPQVGYTDPQLDHSLVYVNNSGVVTNNAGGGIISNANGLTVTNGQFSGYNFSNPSNNPALSVIGADYNNSNYTFTVLGSTFNNNIATVDRTSGGAGGAAISLRNANKVVITDTQFISNSFIDKQSSVNGAYGGAVGLQASDTTLTNVVFDGNSASSPSQVQGGAYYQSGGSINATNLVVKNNTASGSNAAENYIMGAGFSLWGVKDATFADSTIKSNTATISTAGLIYGGGMYARSDIWGYPNKNKNVNLTLTNVRFENNAITTSGIANSEAFGGGLYIKSDKNGNDPFVINGTFNDVTFTNNTATGNKAFGGAIYNLNSKLVFNISQDNLYSGNNVIGAGLNAKALGGFLYLDTQPGLQASATFTIAADKTLMIGNSSLAGLTDSTMDSIASTAGSVITKTGAGSMIVNSSLNDYQGEFNITAGLLALNRTLSPNSGTVNFNVSNNAQLQGAMNNNNGILDVKLNQGNWLITGDTSINSLAMNAGSTVNTTNDGNRNININIDTLNNYDQGGGELNLTVNTTAGTGDNLVINTINNTSAQINIHDINPKAGPSAPIAIFSTQQSAEEFAHLLNTSVATNSPIDGGILQYWPEYSVVPQGDRFAVQITGAQNNPNANPSTTAQTINQMNIADYQAWRLTNNDLAKRMGELRNSQEGGLWARIYGDESKGKGFTSQSTSIQVGVDKRKEINKGAQFLGFAVSHGDTDIDYNNITGSGDSSNTSIGLYQSTLYKDGHYLDIIYKAGRNDNNFQSINNLGQAFHGDYKNYGHSLITEFGQRHHLKAGWFVEPQSELTLGRINSSNYTINSVNGDISVSSPSKDMSTLRAGFTLGREFLNKDNKKDTFYVRALAAHEFSGNNTVHMSDALGQKLTMSESMQDTWYEWAIGGTKNFGKTNIYVDLEKVTSGKINSPWKANFGTRWDF